uniref:Putative serine-threonine/tyrosine-protein kinase catalytic domain-containing protein n=1 Tax=Helianthus annuus TaxID=4232 RepID=A0A251TD51_HELAN
MASTMLINKFAHLQIPLEDVIEATNHFHDDNIIGRGGFGLVYKGELKRSGNLIKIAALRLDRKQGEGDVEFWTQISMLSDLKHTNIVSIIGFCNEKDEKIIITTYAAKGSLKEHLNSPNLTWMQRLKICVGVARALSYLHHDEERGYAIIHRNINSSTILLDENHEAKLSGFKVYLKQPVNRMDRVILSEPVGTIGYMDPEIEKSKGVTHKSDIYSFGVVLFEVLCGRKAFTPNNENRLLAPLAIHHYDKKTLKDIIYPNLRNQVSSRSLEKYSYLAYFCLKEQRAQRPDTYNIVKELEEALEFQLEREKVI